ncbi:MAG: PD40 domain-containing protein [Armatimonadetes bacterium]|nr:PD40 domain-containing protein [Armatimonadota bacterium]
MPAKRFALPILIVLVSLQLHASTYEGPIKRARYPSLSPAAERLAFSYQGDIWVVPVGGGNAERLTVHPANESMPRWSPDGDWIAFSSERNGSMDIFAMSADGGAPRRLTFGTGNEYAMGWTPDSQWVLFYSTRWGRLDIMKVNVSGGEPIRLTGDDMEWEFFPAVSPDGSKIAYAHGGGPGSWRRSALTGSGTADIWIADFTTPLSNAENVTRDETPQMWPMWSPDGKTIWYVGDDGTPNLWRMNADGRTRRKVTSHTTDRVRYPSISADGTAIAYEFASEIRVYDTKRNRENRVDIFVPGDQRYNDVTRLTLTSGATHYAPSPGGKRMLLSVHGEIFLTPESGGVTRRMTFFSGRDEEPLWKDEKEFFYVTIQNGNKDVYFMDLEGNSRPFLDSPADEMALELSPDGKTLAFHRGWKEICIVPVDGGEPKVVFRGFFGGALYGDPAFYWAPDSRHIVLTNPTDRGGENIELVDTETGESTRIALLARGSGQPKVTPDGKRVYFRAYEYGSWDLFAVDLVPDPVKFDEDALEEKEEKEEPEKQEPPKMEVDPEGILDRLRRLTSDERDAGEPVSSEDGKTLYFTMPPAGGGAAQIQMVSVTGGSVSAVTSSGGAKSGLTLSEDGKKLYYMEGGRVGSVTLPSGEASLRSFSAEMAVDQHKEARSLFDEIWWVLDRIYYDPRHHGRDWNSVKTYYSELVTHTYDRAAFYDLMLEMVYELRSSHVGVSGPTQQESTGDDATAILGVEPDWAHLERTGEYRVARVLRGGPAHHPQTRLNVGDVIAAVDGVPPDKEHTLDALLNGKAGKKVVLSVRADGGQVRDVAIKPVPLAAQNALLYDQFVHDKRQMTDRYSGGRLAYLHIQGMNMPSHERFKREVRTLTQGKEGLIIDVRYNGGGFTAHLALGMLVKRPWLIRTNRGWEGRISENLYRGDSVELPSALLINASSFSNAEIIAEGFKRLGVGPVVGVATPGAVIGTSSWTLFDGGSLRTPLAGAYTIEGENLEGNGRKPDIHVPYDPNAILVGEDPQLRRAVEELLRRISGRRRTTTP